jgi:hypothetical protein
LHRIVLLWAIGICCHFQRSWNCAFTL